MIRIGRNLQTISHCRFYATPAIKSYVPLKTPISLLWTTRVPTIVKAFSGILVVALSLTHIHPDILITASPPLLGSGYFLYRKREKNQYTESLALAIKQLKEATAVPLKVPAYDESDIKLAVKGIDSEFDYFLSVVLPAIETRFVDFLVESELSGEISPKLRQLIDENGQVNVNLASTPETFVSLKAEYPDSEDGSGAPQLVKFLSFSVPYYDLKDPLIRQRLGTLQISMLQQPNDEHTENGNLKDNFQDTKVAAENYYVGLRAWPYSAKTQGIVIS